MAAPVLIVGQGLAGSMLAWEFSRAGIDFEVADAGHAGASSRVGAGIINPITGQRLVKSREIDRLREPALAVYREMEKALAVELLRPMQVRRFFRDERERRIFATKTDRGELAPYAGRGGADAEGFWIEGAARIDSARLIVAMRTRLQAAGRLQEMRMTLDDERRGREVVILCTGNGLGTRPEEPFGFVGLRPAKGEMLTVETDGAGLAEDVILNDGHWVLPVGPRKARVGATFEPGLDDDVPTTAARNELLKSARRMLGVGAAVVAQDAGVRMTSPDKRPVVGRHPEQPALGIVNGLGSKGALLAPGLARQWVYHLTEAVPFEAAVDVRRFWKAGGGVGS